MPTKYVFWLHESFESRAPRIDYTFNEKRVDWALIGAILHRRVPHKWQVPQIRVRAKDALEWEYYDCSGSEGLLSERAAEILRPYAAKHLDFFPAQLNGAPYFLLAKRRTSKWLDLRKSKITLLQKKPKVITIQKFAFIKSKIPDPLVFLIPERNLLFGTDGIDELIRTHNIRGLVATDVERYGMDPPKTRAAIKATKKQPKAKQTIAVAHRIASVTASTIPLPGTRSVRKLVSVQRKSSKMEKPVEKIAAWLESELKRLPKMIIAVYAEFQEATSGTQSQVFQFNLFGYDDLVHGDFDPKDQMNVSSLGSFVWEGKKGISFSAEKFPKIRWLSALQDAATTPAVRKILRSKKLLLIYGEHEGKVAVAT